MPTCYLVRNDTQGVVRVTTINYPTATVSGSLVRVERKANTSSTPHAPRDGYFVVVTVVCGEFEVIVGEESVLVQAADTVIFADELPGHSSRVGEQEVVQLNLFVDRAQLEWYLAGTASKKPAKAA